MNSTAANADAALVAALAANVGDANAGSAAALVALAANATKVARLQIHSVPLLSTCQFVCVWFGVFSCVGFVALSGSRSLGRRVPVVSALPWAQPAVLISDPDT